MKDLNQSRCPIHRAAGKLISLYQLLHIGTGSPSKVPKREMTDTPVQSLCPLARKSEYYGLLQKHIPAMIAVWQGFCEIHPFGLVTFADDDVALPASRRKVIGAAQSIAPGSDHITAVAAVHAAAVASIEVYGRFWIESLPPGPFARMRSLIQDRRKANFGDDALRQRVTSAFMEVMNLTAGSTELIVELFERSHERKPTAIELQEIFGNSLIFGLKVSDFHLNEARVVDRAYRTPRMKYPQGCSVEGQRTHFNPDFFAIEDGCLHIATLEPMGDLAQIDTSDGRSGCPGRAYAKDLWNWWDQMARRWIYPTLPSSISAAAANSHSGKELAAAT